MKLTLTPSCFRALPPDFPWAFVGRGACERAAYNGNSSHYEACKRSREET